MTPRETTSYNLGPVKWEAVDALGGELFGRAIRLRLLVWVRSQNEAFFQSQAARAIEYSGVSAVAKELDMLERLGMVRKFGRPNRVGRQNYLREDNPLWSIVDVTVAAIDALATTAPGGRSAEEAGA